MIQETDIDLNVLVDVIPERLRSVLLAQRNVDKLLEVVLDLGRQPEARFLGENKILEVEEVTKEDLEYATSKIGTFGADNRAGIERTLHRISAIRNRNGKIVGITFRVGRAVYGTIRIIEDLILPGQSVLLLGKPGVGKTTMLREVARVLADDAGKRVIVVDTSNEIAGDGDIPHKAIGRARRMQVPSPTKQHDVMIEAVENHMPEVIVIDEISTELEANAARTIAERGVQLVATAHGNTLENLIMNPTLSDLVGGIQTVTLGDIEARRRRTQKTVLERNAPPTFEKLVEIQEWNLVTVHSDVASTVDKMLRRQTINSEVRSVEDDGTVRKHMNSFKGSDADRNSNFSEMFPEPHNKLDDSLLKDPTKLTPIMPYGVNKGRFDQVIRSMNAPITLVGDIDKAEMLVTTKNYHRRGTQALKSAEKLGKPVFVLRKNTVHQIEQFVRAVTKNDHTPVISESEKSLALLEAEQAAKKIAEGEAKIALRPQNSYVRRLQHQIATDYGLESTSKGKEPQRSVLIHNTDGQ